MAEFDLVIRGGTVVDGTGVPKFRADLGIKNGRVAMISGRINGAGAKELDASGCIVAPGAIDLHTHYDAQLNWDPYASMSGQFGVTSLTVGQCGFGFAPTRPEDRDLNMRMMNRIEAIPLESMRQGMRWDWETFPEYMDSLDRQGLGVNVGCLVPFSPLRGYVLGMIPARERTSVTEAELNQMKQILHDSMKAGAFGLSADKNLEDRPEDGSWLPSHVASKEEFLALSQVMGQFGVGHLGWTIGISDDQAGQRAMLEEMVRMSGRPLHVALGSDAGSYEWVEEKRAEGLPIVAQELSLPLISEFKLSEYNLFDYMPNWVQPLVGTKEERIAKLSEDGVRVSMLRDVAERPHARTDWKQVQVVEVAHERNLKYEGLSIAEIAEAEGKDGLDVLLDLALDEDLETEFAPPGREHGHRRDRRGHLQAVHSHLGIRRWRPYPVLGQQHLAGLLPGPLDPGRKPDDHRAGPPKDERPPGLVLRHEESGHPQGLATGPTSWSTTWMNWDFSTTSPSSPRTSPAGRRGSFKCPRACVTSW